MAVIFNPTSGSLLGKYYTDTSINITITATDSLGAVSSVTITADYNDSNVALTNGITDCTIIGSYQLSDFNNTMTYVDQGQSDKTQTPITTSILSGPSFKELYDVTPDPTWTKTITYTVVATSTTGVYTGTFTLILINNFPYIQSWINNYFATRY